MVSRTLCHCCWNPSVIPPVVLIILAIWNLKTRGDEARMCRYGSWSWSRIRSRINGRNWSRSRGRSQRWQNWECWTFEIGANWPHAILNRVSN